MSCGSIIDVEDNSKRLTRIRKEGKKWKTRKFGVSTVMAYVLKECMSARLNRGMKSTVYLVKKLQVGKSSLYDYSNMGVAK